MRSRSKATLPLEPLTSKEFWFLRPAAKRVASKVPMAPFSKRARKAAASSTVTSPVCVPPPSASADFFEGPLLYERLRHACYFGDRSDDEVGEIDDVRSYVAQGA